jgi:hypothetical protein
VKDRDIPEVFRGFEREVKPIKGGYIEGKG